MVEEDRYDDCQFLDGRQPKGKEINPEQRQSQDITYEH